MNVISFHPFVRHLVSVLTIFLTPWAAIAYGEVDTNDMWPENYQRFLVALTYPDSDWSEHDFGRQVNEQNQALLKQFRPRLYVGPGGLLPIDFYRDYLPKTVVKNDAEIIREQPDRGYLKKIERQYGYYLDYQGPHLNRETQDISQYQGSLYGRAITEQMLFPAESPNERPASRDYIILKYNAVFSASGLPGKLSWYKALGASLAGDKDNWHQLDIHGAIHILVNSTNLKPEILLLAQHNHFRSYVIDRDIEWPKDNRLPICFAMRSNEPYPCPLNDTPHYYRTVGSPGNFSYVLTGEGSIFDGSMDKVAGPNAGAAEVKYKLQFLSDKDPLYVSWIPLGDKLKLFGLFNSFYRAGPPGMNINTHPNLKKYTDLAKFWYFKEGDAKAAQLFKRDIKGFESFNSQEILDYHGQKLFQALNNSHHYYPCSDC